MLGADNFSVGIVGERIFPVLQKNLFFHFFEKNILYAFLNVHIIWRDAGLPRVEIFSEHDPLCRKRNIRGFVHNAGTLSAELQGDGDQIFRSLSHDLFSDGDAPRKEDFIEFQIEQPCIFRSAAQSDRHIFFGERLYDNIEKHLRDVRGISGGLQNGGISCRERVRQRFESQ